MIFTIIEESISSGQAKEKVECALKYGLSRRSMCKRNAPNFLEFTHADDTSEKFTISDIFPDPQDISGPKNLRCVRHIR